jgi:hypothetical protein
MRGKISVLAVLLAWVANEVCVPGAKAVVPERDVGQYDRIPERNAFGLRPPPSDPLPTNPPAQLPKITLTGITTILGNKRALMMLAPPIVKPGDTNRQISLILTEGQREADVEVLQIDEKRGSVRLNNSGTVMTLTFEKDGAKLPATAPPRTGVPAPPLPMALPPTAGMGTNPYAPHSRAVGVRNPGRTPRQGLAQNAAAGATNVAAPVGGVPNATGLVAPSPTVGTGAEQELTAEEQAIVSEIQRQANSTIPMFTAPGSNAAGYSQPADSSVSAPANSASPTTAPPVLPQ